MVSAFRSSARTSTVTTMMNQDGSEYYVLFDRKTNGGIVFNEDLSARVITQKTLAPKETCARMFYQWEITSLNQYYRYQGKSHPVATTKEEVLQQRVVAPCLGRGKVSTGTGSRAASATKESKSCRMYPKNIHPWKDFRHQVENYTVIGKADEKLDQIFYTSLKNAADESSDEADEQSSIIKNLRQTLKQAGLVHAINKRDTIVKGNPDFVIKSEGDKISIICECKSTHNLLLPMTADLCKIAYETAFANTNVCPNAWSNVAHPIGQILWYLIDNKHCYGALTSGTRTYFLKIEVPDHINTNSNSLDRKIQASHAEHEDSSNPVLKKMKMEEATTGTPIRSDNGDFQTLDGGDGIRAYISDAWFVGQANYLRAWAYVHHLRETMPPLRITPDWFTSTTELGTPEQRGKKFSGNIKIKEESTSPSDGPSQSRNEYGGEFVNTCNIEYFYPLHHGAIPFAPYDDIVTVGVLGEGRNGGCFKVQWKGTEHAMKQFDIGKYGNTHFVKEIRAYIMLKDVWGILVPRPIFVSESYSGNVMFLGLQLGHESKNVEDYKKFEDVLTRLKKEYGIRHNDADCRNMIAIMDRNGEERVVAIDFEDWDEVQIT